MATLCSDNFDRANGAIGSNWTNAGGTNFAISSNRAVASADQTTALAFWAGTFNPASADYDVQAVCQEVAGSEFADLWVVGRYVDIDNYYECGMWDFGGQLFVGENVDGVYADIGTWNYDFAKNTDYTIKLSMAGTALKGYLDGTERISGTDDTFTATGKPGIAGVGHSATSQSVNDFIVTGTEAGGATVVKDLISSGIIAFPR